MLSMVLADLICFARKREMTRECQALRVVKGESVCD
jgi:hypothetical protein